jgi:putative nucleotidyltransferase with HDIG domain
MFPSLEKWFDNYTKTFQFNDKDDQKKIDLKYKHSYNVCEFAEELARNLNLKEEEVYIAKISGLFHDIGRFEQYARYKTFSDRESVDHGKLGVKILEEKGTLVGLQQNAQEIVVKSIYHHNKPVLPEKEQSNTLKYCKLIRDADKLDIYNLFVKRYQEEKPDRVAGQHLENKPEISPTVFNQLMAGKVISYEDLRTIDDLKLMQLGWLYDINYPRSFELIEERGYLQSIYSSMSPSEEARVFYEKVREYLESKLTDKQTINL